MDSMDSMDRHRLKEQNGELKNEQMWSTDFFQKG
jgi:hypothetical protein